MPFTKGNDAQRKGHETRRAKKAATLPTADELRERFAALNEEQQRQAVARLRYEREVRRTTWLCRDPRCSGRPHDACPTRHARANQRLPFKRGDGRIGALWMAGRGFGKTRIGAEATRLYVQRGYAGRIGLIARTAADVRDVMIEGESGSVRNINRQSGVYSSTMVRLHSVIHPKSLISYVVRNMTSFGGMR